MVKSP